MAVIRDRQRKLVVQVNTGTSTSPTLKNRQIGSGYIINPTATDDIMYQAGTLFGTLQAHDVNDIWTEIYGELANS